MASVITRNLKFLPITFLCLLVVIKGWAQTDNDVQNLHTAKLTFLGLSYNYEYAIAKQTVLTGELMLVPVFYPKIELTMIKLNISFSLSYG